MFLENYYYLKSIIIELDKSPDGLIYNHQTQNCVETPEHRIISMSSRI